MKTKANNNLPLYKAIIATLLLHFIILAGCCDDSNKDQVQKQEVMGKSMILRCVPFLIAGLSADFITGWN
jgi:hypothetical protein